MKVIIRVTEMREHSKRMRGLGKTIAFVPTMGALHEAHLALIKEGRKLGDDLVVSIFANPSQFSPEEDFESYPRNFDKDLKLLQKKGVDVIFSPNEDELYQDGFQTYVELENLPNHLCGISRPIFFRGVATVVTKLFNIVRPHIAIFGGKDYQQLAVIRRMVRDLNFDIKIVGFPTVREPDGLAMSSRNSYLTPEQRINAVCLYKSLKQSQELVESGIKDAKRIIDAAYALIKSHPETAIDYIAICDPETLADMETIDRPALMALAVNVGKTRLIDNMIL
ncbi:MAG: pantoate--beta-alanine ligase [Desulfobacterales bacterium]|uniref:Pantothenate synthetase n=1 Tax=Candidatus Desulfaltia bathyphila TaxID=2841697 RepID=A0A8J6T9M4_9BACT|nr:pantoate--beta-alanine ligase [Candidatus Desulfaltia bathyphila]MBL7195080.1 pantoate--beta-alanine ligase [Desulfobacterales bacterium]MBL7206995.1 pantoate--beta-alanine ligase [Desulfobacterales bacterium]